jgi:N-acyl-L-homoserine lactone synthetase
MPDKGVMVPMIDLVLPESRFGFAGALMEMHRDRKRVFVDQLGWDLPVRGSWLEVDEFDNDYAVYLLARSGDDGAHQASLRLLPTMQPHMLQRLFAMLCAGPVPIGEDVWEISRLVGSPAGASGTTILRMHRLLALALVEFAALNQVRSFTLVIEANRLPALLAVGWPVVPLGLPSEVQGDLLQALRINVNAGTLPTMRARFGIFHTVLRAPDLQQKAA